MKLSRFTWKHSDKRGKQVYSTIDELADALNVQYATAWRYISKGYTGDSDLKSARKPMAVTRPTKHTGRRRELLHRIRKGKEG